MVGQQLFAQDLVPRQHQAARVTARIRLAQQLQIRDHVLVVTDDAVEFLEQVEHEVWLAILDRQAKVGEAVENAYAVHLVAGPLERRNYVVLSAPLVDFLLGVPV